MTFSRFGRYLMAAFVGSMFGAAVFATLPGCSNKPDLPEMSEEDAAKIRDLNVPPMGSPKDMPPTPEDTVATDGFNPPVMSPGKGAPPQPQQ